MCGTKNGSKLKMRTGLRSSQALNLASDLFSIVERCIADLSDSQRQDHADTTRQAEADEVTLNRIISEGSGRSSRQASQQAPIKILTRPLSSGKDPAAGFSFSKAKPMQQLDFRRPKQCPGNPQLPDLPPSKNTPTETVSRLSPPRTKTTQDIPNVLDVTVHQRPVNNERNASVLKDPLPLSPQNPRPTDSLAHSYPTTTAPSTAPSGPIRRIPTLSRAPSNEGPMTADDSVNKPNLAGTQDPGGLNITTPGHNNLATTTLPPMHGPTEIGEVADRPQSNMQNRSHQASRGSLTSVAGVPKVTKSGKRSTKIRPAIDGAPQPTKAKTAYTENDLLKLLMYRRRQEQQELEYLRAAQQQKDAEVQKLGELSDQLSGQLQEAVQREAQKTAELSKIKAKKPGWERKIKQLSDYVKGLTNDHRRLREDADDLRKQHGDVFIARGELHSSLADAQKSLEQERIRSQQFEDGARHRIEALVQTVQNQSRQLQSDEGLLVAERERSDRLEVQMSCITSSNAQLLELFTSHRDTVTDRINNLLHQARTMVPPEKSPELDSHDPIRPMLQQCVEILQRLQEVQAVKPEDLQKLNDTMENYVRGYVNPSTVGLSQLC